jgi:N-acetyldiaminopimelate deacetylase
MLLDPIQLRHRLHQNPELMFKEFATTSLLVENIGKLNNIKIHKPLETGLVVEYTVNGGDYLLFRADIDALPIKEETGISFASLNENMHACGHDVHTSILYGFLNYVASNKIDQNILFLFQPGEEGGGGAKKVIDSGIFNKFKIRNAFALHVNDSYEKGTVASTTGVLFASSYEVDFEFFGRSAHVAFPENGKNAFDALTLFIGEAKKTVHASEEKLIFGYGKINSGNARNIVPGYAKLEATLRAMNRSKAVLFLNKMEELLVKIKEQSGVDFKIGKGINYEEVVINDELFNKLLPVLSSKFRFQNSGSAMAGEDFGFISKLYPSFMFWLGTFNGEKHGLHNPKFLPDDSVIEIGIDVYKTILNEIAGK